MSAKEQIIQAASSPKLAATVSAATTSTGMATVLEWIPDDIGKLATLVGIVLSLLLIYSHSLTIRKSRIELRRMEAEEVRTASTRRRESASQPAA
jgi:hypothetical protein